MVEVGFLGPADRLVAGTLTVWAYCWMATSTFKSFATLPSKDTVSGERDCIWNLTFLPPSSPHRELHEGEDVDDNLTLHPV